MLITFANALAARGEIEASLSVLKQAGGSYLRDLTVQTALGRALLAVERVEEAIETFSPALDRYLEMDDLRGWLALSSEAAHKPDRAATVLEPIIQRPLQQAKSLPVLAGLLAASPSLKASEREDIFFSCVTHGAEVPEAALCYVSVAMGRFTQVGSGGISDKGKKAIASFGAPLFKLCHRDETNSAIGLGT